MSFQETRAELKKWKPQYERWRHGGWYVSNITYPSGAIGCVSNNYPDKKWRIACGPQDLTFSSRNEAAYAERAMVFEAWLEIALSTFEELGIDTSFENDTFASRLRNLISEEQ